MSTVAPLTTFNFWMERIPRMAVSTKTAETTATSLFATFRLRNQFILSSFDSAAPRLFLTSTKCRRLPAVGILADHLFGVEHVHQTIVQFVNAADKGASALAESVGRMLKSVFARFYNVADVIH